MDFSLHEDTKRLAEGARAFLTQENTVARLREAEQSSGLELMPQIASLGLFGIEAPESLGGLGLSAVESVAIAEEAGHVALPEPLTEIAGLLVPMLVHLGRGELAQSVAQGHGVMRIASPLCPFVGHARRQAQVLIVTPRRVALAEPKDCLSPLRSSIDPWRRLARVDLEAAGEVLASDEAAHEACQWLNARGTVLIAAELCGLARRMIELATEYANTREQFGAPIGSFQAVQHLLADARVRLEFARPVVYRAAAALAQIDLTHRDLLASHAKLAATDAATLASENAIQVFGAFGYTFEADLHYFMKRSWALAGLWGDREFHLQRLDAHVFDGDAAIGPGTSYGQEKRHD